LQRSPSARDLDWDGCLNVRELGGHPTRDGGMTRRGSIVRADSMRRLTDAGWESAVAYGIRTVVDLRTDRERDADAPADLPIEVVHVELFGEDPAFSDEVDPTIGASDDPAARIAGTYLDLLERFRANVVAALRAIADGDEGGVAIHCAGGKDRTGIVTALLLSLAGVERAEIGADYAWSRTRLRPRHEQWLALAENDEEREAVRRLISTPAEAIVRVLDELDERFGGVEEYLRGGGLRDTEIARLRARLAA
jgi:protein-tyrosine phosphatase